MPKVICFDLWKTLAREPYSMGDYWSPLLKKYPAMIDDERLGKLVDEFAMKRPLKLRQAVDLILGELGVCDSEIARLVTARWRYSCNRASLFDDVLPTLVELRGRGYMVGLISNTSAYGWGQLNRRYNLSSYFDVIARSFVLGAVKPESALFEYVEERCGLPSNEIMMVGDSYENDMVPARDRGWEVLLFSRDLEVLATREVPFIRKLGEFWHYL